MFSTKRVTCWRSSLQNGGKVSKKGNLPAFLLVKTGVSSGAEVLRKKQKEKRKPL